MLTGQKAALRKVLGALFGDASDRWFLCAFWRHSCYDIYFNNIRSIKDKFGRRAGKAVLPKITPAIEKSDEALRELLEGVDPERLAKILGTIGRQRGVEFGAEAQQYESPLLPRSK